MRAIADRRLALRDYISNVRHTTIAELTREFNVSRSTIRRDIDALSEIASIYLISGNGGGVHAVDGWYASRIYLSAAQENLLRKLEIGLQNDSEKKLMESILKAFAKPRIS